MLKRLIAIALLAASPALAGSPPQVATDIAPIHSLAARVMQSVGMPALIIPPGASPHDHAMRPSEAAALERAEVVIWLGGGLAPNFREAIAALAPEARSVELAGTSGLTTLPVREAGTFEAHDHGHGHGDHEHGHDHGSAAIDSHLWLDPRNAALWLVAIADALAEADPANAAQYRENAAAGQVEIEALIAEIDARLAPVKGRGFIVFHDAYQYFEARFAMPAAGAISLGDAGRPGARRVEEIRARIRELGAACVFIEPQFAPRLVATVMEGTEARQAVLDPIGAGLEPGAGLYPALIRNMAGSLADCLGG